MHVYEILIGMHRANDIYVLEWHAYTIEYDINDIDGQ